MEFEELESGMKIRHKKTNKIFLVGEMKNHDVFIIHHLYYLGTWDVLHRNFVNEYQEIIEHELE